MTGLNDILKTTIKALELEEALIPKERKALLQDIALSIAAAQHQYGQAKIIVICTHNSRRSHTTDIWLQTAAQWHGLTTIDSWSGGTEVSAFHPNMIAALKRAGFTFTASDDTANPVYHVTDGNGQMISKPLCSKRYDDAANPVEKFIALLVCSSADEACPSISGTYQRLALPYDDPGKQDGTAGETAAYDECVRTIGREMLYLVRQILVES